MTLRELLDGAEVQLDALRIRVWDEKTEQYELSIPYYEAADPARLLDMPISYIYTRINKDDYPEIVVDLVL